MSRCSCNNNFAYYFNSLEVVDVQYQHLVDEEKYNATEFRFGSTTGKYIIYSGETQDVSGIHYLNVEEHLNNLIKE